MHGLPSFGYDAEYKLKGIVAPSGLRYSITQNNMGHIQTVDLPGGKKLTYGYDAYGNLTSYKDALGNVTTYQYDAGHHMTSWVDANGAQIIHNIYDAEGRVTQQTDGRGQPTTFAYTPGTTSITDANGTTTYHYDNQ